MMEPSKLYCWPFSCWSSAQLYGCLGARTPARRGWQMREPRLYLSLPGSVGERIHYFDVDVEAATLTMRGSVLAPSNVQYAWPTSIETVFLRGFELLRLAVPAGSTNELNCMTAFRVDTATGALQPHGEPQTSPSRPIYMTVDGTGNFALAASNIPPIVTVLRINPDGTIGAEVKQPRPGLASVLAFAQGHTEQPRRDRGRARKRSHPQNQRGIRVRSRYSVSMTGCCRIWLLSPPAAAWVSGRGTWTFTRRSRGSTSRGRRRTSLMYIVSRAIM